MEQLVKSMQLSEKRKFANDSAKMAAARILFVRWMKECHEWEKYKRYLTDKSTKHFITRAWESPKYITDFLGETSYEYSVYESWCNFCDAIEPTLRKAYCKAVL